MILDTYNKTTFLGNGIIYEKIDRFSMGASWGPLLANIIMTELKRVVVDELVNDGTPKFNSRYVDNTLLILNPEGVDEVLQEFIAYHPNLNCVPHFFYLELHQYGIRIYRNNTHTAQFTHFSSFTKWGHKIAWSRFLVDRAKRLCEPSKLAQEIAKVKKFA